MDKESGRLSDGHWGPPRGEEGGEEGAKKRTNREHRLALLLFEGIEVALAALRAHVRPDNARQPRFVF